MKRLFDFSMSVMLAVLLFPLFVLIALLVRRHLGAPVLFTQMRPGWRGRPFFIYKFRTLTRDTDAMGNLLSDAERLTRFGALLRRSSLDELPELINVIKGEMSLVGPRPLLMQYLDRYDQCRPGGMRSGRGSPAGPR
jgi:sugar transferase EpsL